jgi:glycosyltransferase involved in cell wall biosynthesis
MARTLTVLQMLPALDGGGVERGTLEVAKALVDAGHRSLVMSAGGRLVEDLVAQGSEHFCWPVHRKSLLTLRLIWRLRRFLREQAVDILHVRSRAPAWVAWLGWRAMPADRRPRFITTVHGLYSVNIYSKIMLRGERVIAVSNTVRDYILQNYPDIDPRVIEVIPRGVDPAEWPGGYRPSAQWLDAWYAQYPQLQGRQVLTLPGRLTRLKGHRDFIDLIARLRAQGEDVHGLIVGGEDLRRLAYAKELRALIADSGLGDAITFTGQRADIKDIYAVSDIVFSLSTKPESFGRAVLEALSIGRPVIGYAHGGVGEVLRQLYPQGVVDLADQQGLTARVAGLLDKAPPVPTAHPFTLDRMLTSTLDLYQELVGPGSAT